MNTIYNTIFVNGEAFNCCQSMSLLDLLNYLNCDMSVIIVEHNKEIIPNIKFEDIMFNNNDKLEIITIVGGG